MPMSKKRILFIDDEENFTTLVKLILEKDGEYEIRTESNASQALTTAREFQPDMIFLDVIMPSMDGPTIASELAMDEHLKDVPIVFLTATASKDEVTEGGGKIGGRPFLAKPVNHEELTSCIQETLGE